MKKTRFFLAVFMIMVFGITLSAAAEDSSWTCENGHEGNTGNFCVECGAAKPAAPEEWTCENGHEGNTGNFCSECGAAKPAVPEEWTCINGHEGNTGNFCSECGAAKSTVPAPAPEEPAAAATAAAPETEGAQPETSPAYDNPFPAEISLYTTPFTGIVADHQVALAEVLSHASPEDEIYVTFEKTGKASDQLAYDKYSGKTHDLYLVYQNGGKDVYAYVYACEYDPSQRTEWAAGSLFPNLLNAVSSVLWVESGEDNDRYSALLDQGSAETDHEAAQRLIRSLEPGESAQWFSHRVSMFREETGEGKDRYWVIYHNTQ